MQANSSQIRIREYIDIFFYRKWLFIIPFAIVVIISIIVTFFLPEIYRATVNIEVITSPLVSTYDLSTGVKQHFDILRERVLSQSVLKRVIDKLQSDEYPQASDIHESIEGLRANTIIMMIGNQMIRVSYDGRDKERTSGITRALASAFIEESFKKREEEDSSAVDFIKSELEYYRNRLNRGDNVVALTEDLTAKHLRDKLSILETKLTEMLMDSREDHPTVIDLRRAIADTKKEIELTNVDTEIIDEASAEREIHLNEALYVELLSKLEMVRISQRLKREEERTKFRIIDLDRIMVYKIAPNKKKVVTGGFILGMLLAIGFVSLVEFVDHSFKGIEDAKGFLILPTLGAIPEVDTD